MSAMVAPILPAPTTTISCMVVPLEMQIQRMANGNAAARRKAVSLCAKYRYIIPNRPRGLDRMTSDADRALIALLREDARASTAEMARRLGVSRTTVQSRLERLERSGVIAGYSVKLSADYERNLVRAHILVTALPKLSASVETVLRRIPEVRTLHSV